MNLDLHDVNGLDEKTIHMLDELITLLKTLDTERLTDLLMTMTTALLQTEIEHFDGKPNISTNDFWMEATGRILILISEQDSRGAFTKRTH